MAKFRNPFRGVPAGKIYPVQYERGDECPKELEASAKALGALDDAKPAKKAKE